MWHPPAALTLPPREAAGKHSGVRSKLDACMPRVAHRVVRGARVASLACLGLLAVNAVPVRAEGGNDEEQLIGTFMLKGSASKAATLPAGAAAPPVAQAAGTAADQLGSAVALFAAGDRVAGQRALEQLVVRFPDSAEAVHARKTLGDLYRQQSAASAQPVAAQPVAVQAGASVGLVQPPAAPQVGPSHTIDGWVAKVQRDAGLERRFIMEVGDRVFFSLGSADLGSRARAVLTAQARWLNANPALTAVIEGHADEPGSDDANRDVAQKRADAVRNRLVEEGVAPDRLKAVGLGRTQRVSQCDDPDCAAQNRRVVTALAQSGRAPSPLGALPGDQRPGPLTAASWQVPSARSGGLSR